MVVDALRVGNLCAPPGRGTSDYGKRHREAAGRYWPALIRGPISSKRRHPASLDPFQPIASVSFEEGRFSSPAYLRSCLLSDYEPRDVNIRYSATYQYSKAAEIFWLPNSAVRDPPFLNWPGLLFKTLSDAPDRLRSIMKSSLLRPGTCNSVAHWRHHE
jgi:hypothetical protein